MVLWCTEYFFHLIWDNVVTLCTIILAITAVVQVYDIKNIIKQYAFSAFLNQENDLSNKRSTFENTLRERAQLLRTAHPTMSDISQFESVQTRLELEKQLFLLALDRFASQILKPEFPEKKLMKNIHRDFLDDTISKYATEIEDTHFENITKLQIRWR